MKKKPSTKPTDQDLKDWNSFINNISNIEDKDAPYDSILDRNQSQNLFDIRKDLHGFKMHEALEEVSKTIIYAIENKLRKNIHGEKYVVRLTRIIQSSPYISLSLSLIIFAMLEQNIKQKRKKDNIKCI